MANALNNKIFQDADTAREWLETLLWDAMFLDTVASRQQARLRLELAGSSDFWAVVAADLFVLGQYAVGLTLNLVGEALDESGRKIVFPSPHRPRLLSLRRIAEIENQIRLLHAPKVRKRQQRASRRKP